MYPIAAKLTICLPLSYPSFLLRRLDCPEIRQSTKSIVAFDELVDGSCLDLFDDSVDGSCLLVDLLNCPFSPVHLAVTLFSSFARTVTRRVTSVGQKKILGLRKIGTR